MAEGVSLLRSVESFARTWGVILIVGGAVAAVFISRHDVDTLKTAFDANTAATSSGFREANASLKELNQSFVDLKVGQATLSGEVKTLATSTSQIAVTAVTQTQMAEHVRAAELEHAAMRKEFDEKISGLQKQEDGLSGRIDRLERQRDGDGKH